MRTYISESAYPDYSYGKITDITPMDVKMMGAKAVAIDLDNTTVAYGSTRPEEGVKDWIKKMEKEGIKVIIVTNALAGRAFIISRRMGGVPVLPLAFKPATRGLEMASKVLGVDVEDIAMIGDQLFSDVLAANRAGSVSVKVEPIGDEPFFRFYFEKKRELERLYLAGVADLKARA